MYIGINFEAGYQTVRGYDMLSINVKYNIEGMRNSKCVMSGLREKPGEILGEDRLSLLWPALSGGDISQLPNREASLELLVSS